MYGFKIHVCVILFLSFGFEINSKINLYINLNIYYMTTNLLSLQKKRSFLSALSVLAFLLLTVNVFGQTVSSVSPSTITNRTRVSLVGTGFTSTGTVKLGVSSASAVSANYTFIDATHAQIIPGNNTPDGTLNIYFGSSTTPAGTLTKLAPVATPANAKVDRLITDFNGYKSTTAATTNVADMYNNRHNVIGFTYNAQVYSTGVSDVALTPARVGTYIPGDFRALPLNEIVGNSVTSSSSTYIQLGSLVDGNADVADVTSPAVAGLKIRDVLVDGIKGLDIGTGVTNVGADVALVFSITSVSESRINDSEPDIVVSQIAQPGGADDNDIYSFIDANGNIVGNPVQVSYSGVNAIGTNRVDLFRLTSASYSTAVPNGVNTTNDTKDIRLVAYKISDFGITTAAVANTIKGFKILPSGSSDPAFIAYNANAFVIPFPVIQTQPVSVNKCGTSSSATFSVVATGMDLTYQWTKNGTTIAGATAASYTIATPVPSDGGEYVCIISNLGGSVTSQSAFLTVSGTGSNSTTWNGSVSNDWNTASNWSCGIVPSASVSANIPTGVAVYPVLSSATGTALNLTIATGAVVTVNGTGNLRIAGVIKKAGTFNAIDGTVSFIGTTAQNIPANTFITNYIKNLTINNTAGVTLAGELSLTGVLAPTAGAFTTGNQLTLKSNATTTAVIAQVTGSISGQMTIERYIPSKRAFRFITSTVDGGSVRSNWQENGVDDAGWGTDITGAGGATNGFDASGSNNPSLFSYNNTNTTAATSWNAVTSTSSTTLTAGTPYRLLVRGDRTVNQFLNASPSSVTTLRTTGTVKTGNVVYSNLTATSGRYVFVGNPYQAQVDIQAVLNNSVGFNKSFYQIWDPTVNSRGAYVTYNVGTGIKSNTGSSVNKYAQPGQAFFLQTNAATQTLTFAEANKLASNQLTNVYRTGETLAKMSFNLYEDAALAETGTSADGFVVVFDEAYSNAVDENDAVKMGNLDENAGTSNAGKVLSYESRNLPTEADVIPLSHNQYRSTNYTYKVNVQNLNTNAFLLDKYTNTRTPLQNGGETSVSFIVDLTNTASTAPDRFDVVFGTTLSTGESAFANAVSVYPNPITENQFFVKLPAQEGEALTVKLVNLLGQEVYSKKLNVAYGIVKIQPETALQSGVYLVNISSANHTATKKLIVK